MKRPPTSIIRFLYISDISLWCPEFRRNDPERNAKLGVLKCMPDHIAGEIYLADYLLYRLNRRDWWPLVVLLVDGLKVRKFTKYAIEMWTWFLSFSSVQWSELVTKLLQGSDLWLCRWALWRCLLTFLGVKLWLSMAEVGVASSYRWHPLPLCSHFWHFAAKGFEGETLMLDMFDMFDMFAFEIESIGKIFQVPKRWAKATLEAAQCSSWICGARESLERPSNSNIFQMHGTRLPLLKLFLSYYDNYNYALQLW